jgi:hypothetical protein
MKCENVVKIKKTLNVPITNLTSTVSNEIKKGQQNIVRLSLSDKNLKASKVGPYRRKGR